MKLTRGFITHVRPPAPHFAHTDSLDRGLVGEWRLDVFTGVMIPDRSGFENHGAFAGTGGDPAWVTTEYGPAVLFSGPSANEDRITVPDAGSLDVTTYWSLETFFTPTTTIDVGNSQGGGLIYKDGAYGYWFQDGDGGRLRVGTFGGNVQSNRATWTAGQWHHVIAVHDGNTTYIYVNGTLDNSGANADPMVAMGTVLWIGYSSWPTVDSFDGTIALARVYKRVLNACEVAAQYQVVRRRVQELGGVWTVPFGRAPVAVTAGRLVDAARLKTLVYGGLT